MTTEEKINQLQAQIDELRKEVKPNLEVGKWYKTILTNDDSKPLYCVTKVERHDFHAYGFDYYGAWVNDEYFGCINSSEIKERVPATDKEVEEALIKEAERRGFKEGAKFKCLELGKIREYKQYDSKDWGTGKNLSLRYFSDGNHLFCNDGLWNKDIISCSNPSIFRDGKWAEIIKDEPVKVGGYEVKKGLFNDCVIGCKKINLLQVHNIRVFMKEYDFKKVAFDGIEVDLETIEKILKL